MRRSEILAAARLALRPFRVRGTGAGKAPAREHPVSAEVIGALAAGMLLAVVILALTGTRAPGSAGSEEVAAHDEAAMDADEPFMPDAAPLFTPRATLSPPEDFIDDDGSAFQPDEREIRWFNNRPIRPVKTISMLVTAYSPDEESCGEWADGITASGYSVFTNGMKLVAADTSILPFGSLVSVPNYDGGNVVPVLDRGGAIRGHRLDVLYPTHERALEWGVQRLEVTVWEYADGEPNGFRQQHHNWW